MTLKLKVLLIVVLGFVAAGFTVPRFAGAQASYYTWNLIAGYTYPYQDLPSSIQYPFKIISVSVKTRPKSDRNAKYCRLYLEVFAEQTMLANNQVNFDIDPKTFWRTDNGCVLSLVGEPDLNARVAIITDDSATPQAVRGTTMDALVFPDFSSRDWRKALMIDPGLQTYTQFLFPTPTPAPTPKVAPTRSRYAVDESSDSSDGPPLGIDGDYRQPLAVTVPRTTSLRTVTFPHSYDCKSLTVFRPSNE